MHIHVKFEKERRNIWRFSAEAKVDGKVVCSADLMCARREF
jgi:3-hydroxyacyl-[acyl-carrier-protein] dehydratase